MGKRTQNLNTTMTPKEKVIEHVIDGKPKLMKAARYMRSLINLAAISLPVIFTWLKFKGVDFAPIAKDITADIIFKGTLAVYYVCWVAGLQSDTSDQEYVFLTNPDWRHVFIGGTFLGTLITVMFGVLCYVDTSRQFALFLAIFLLINIVSWKYLVRAALFRSFHQSQAVYIRTKKYAKLEQLRLVYETYLCGKWQWMRFASGCVIVAIMNYISQSSGGLPYTLKAWGVTINSDMAISLTTLSFVTTMEVWIWYMRLRVKAGLQALDDVQSQYKIEPIL